MGICAHTKFFWGVNLSWNETLKLRQAVAAAFANSGVAFEEYSGSPTLDKIACLVAHAFPSLKHLDFLTMIADGADSGADTIYFTEGYTHGVGMTVAEKVAGYPPSAALTPTPLQLQAYATVIQPLMLAAGLTQPPELHSVVYTG